MQHKRITMDEKGLLRFILRKQINFWVGGGGEVDLRGWGGGQEGTWSSPPLSCLCS